MLADLRFALRQLAKSPGFAVVAILSLALGIGANTAVFSVTNAVLLAQLPVKNPEQLVVFNWLADENVSPQSTSGWQDYEPGSKKTTSTSFSIPTFEAFAQQHDALDAMFAFAPTGSLNVIVDGAAEITGGGQLVSGGYHAGLGVTALAGRVMTPEDDTASAPNVVVISYAYWQRRFGGDVSAIGKAITVNGVPTTIIGVTPPAFRGAMQVGETVDLTLPLAHDKEILRPTFDSHRPAHWWVRIMGRLKPGATREQAVASLAGAFRETIRGTLDMRMRPGEPSVAQDKIPPPQLRAMPGGQGLYEARRNYEKSLRLLIGIVGLVLLVACANVANLLLARGAARRREIAVRLALGASRARIVRQLLAESVLLAALGSITGLLFATWGARALIAMNPFGSNTLTLDLSLDWRMLGFASAAALATGVIFGLAPALRATRLDLTAEFQGGARSLGAGSRSPLAKSLMAVQVALSLVLLVGAGLFIRTLRNLQNVDVGFNRERLLLFSVNAVANGTSAPEAHAAYQRMRERFTALPGVNGATFARVPLLSQSNWTTGITVPGYTPTSLSDNSVRMNGVDPSYLTTVGIPLLRGRDFDARDIALNAPKTAIVDQVFAKKYFGTEDIIGRRITTNATTKESDIEIIGLVRESRYSDVRSASRPVALMPFAQLNPKSIAAAHFSVRYTGSESTILASLRGVVRDIDASLPLSNVRTQEQQIDRLFTQERLFAKLCAVFGGLALLLSAVGLYGLMSYAVLRRTSEIGLRMALGALPTHVMKMILRESLGLVGLGLVIGIAVAFGVSRFVSSMLFGLSTTDPLTYVVVAGLLATVAFAACLLPARRAAKIDPMVALRTE